MKKIILLFAFLTSTFLTQAQTNVWTWMSGMNYINSGGIYGTKGVASTSNMPSARAASVSWKDTYGNFWLMGGNRQNGSSNYSLWNDLWKYNTSTQAWTWVSGDNISNQSGRYGVKGVASASNKPSSRNSAVSWADASGVLWLFGGALSGGTANDLWKFDITNSEWTWMGGDSLNMNKVGVFGTKGVAAPNNMPSSRYSAVSWTDTSGNLWLFGGYGYLRSGTGSYSVYLNDLWKYNIQSGMWTWVCGDTVGYSGGKYGTQGIANSTNKPTSRYAATSWFDKSGNNLWLFGGLTNIGYKNDLWKYNISTNQWTWMKGDSIPNRYSNAYAIGVSNINYNPSSRYGAAGWVDTLGNLWLGNGIGYGQSFYGPGYLPDLWKYNIITNQWAWMTGAANPGNNGNYGAKGVPSSSNAVGQRVYSITWVDNSGNLWLFGGKLNSIYDYLNDLWEYNPPCQATIIVGKLDSVQYVCQNTTPTTLSFQATGTSLTCQWYSNTTNSTIGGTLITGATSKTYVPPTNVNGTHYYYAVATGNCTPAQDTTNCAIVVVAANFTPTVSIVSSFNHFCPTVSDTITATPIYGGLNPTYNFKVNSISVQNSSSNKYITTNFVNGDVVTCVLTSSLTCKTSPTVTSNSLTINIIAGNPVPSVSIAANTLSSVCFGSPIVFTATPTNGGLHPTYNFKINGVSIQNSGIDTFSTTGLSNGDIVSCVMTTSFICASTPTATSNSLTISNIVTSSPVTSVGISKSGNCMGLPITITATPTNNGSNTTYNFSINGTSMQNSTSNTYTSSGFLNNEVVTCVMTTNNICHPTATSNSITLHPSYTVIPTVGLTSNNYANLCQGGTISFTAHYTNGGSNPTVNFLVNGVSVQNNWSTNYSSSSLNNGDLVKCILTPNNTCQLSTYDTSNIDTVQILPFLIPTNSISLSANNVCSGTPITVTATGSNYGSPAPYYDFWVNSVKVQSTLSNIYTSSTFNNGDIVVCILIPNYVCATYNGNSNVDTLHITPIVTPNVSVSPSVNNVCTGANITVIATTTTGGASPTYNFKVNGTSVQNSTANGYSSTTFANGDVVNCVMTANNTCQTTSTANSNNANIIIQSNVTPSVSISSNPSGTINAGTNVTFTATPTNGGSSPSYDFNVNGTSVQNSASNAFSTPTLNNGDIVSCILTSNHLCQTTSTSTSNSITMAVNPSGINEVSNVERMQIVPNPCSTCEVILNTNITVNELQITDLLGRKIETTFTKSAKGYLIEMNTANAGVYFIRNTKTGQVIKFVKE